MQFRRVVSAIFFKLHSKTCGYLLIIRHLANKKLVLRPEKPCFFFQRAISSSVLFLPACYFVLRAISSSVLFRPACYFVQCAICIGNSTVSHAIWN